MNPTAPPSQSQFDDSLLSAYLDGELDEVERLVVDRAMAADPVARRMLEELSATRDLLSSDSLPTPSLGIDLSSQVLARIERAQAVGGARKRWAIVATSLTTLAALALVAVAPRLLAPLPTLAPRRGGVDLAQGGAPSSNAQAEAPRRTDISVSDAETGPTRSPSEKDSAAGPPVLLTEARSSTTNPRLGGSSDDLFQATEPTSRQSLSKRMELVESTVVKSGERLDPRERLRELLGRPGLVRIVVEADRIDARDLQAIDNILARESLDEPDFLRLSLSQQIVIDPAHPQDAVVFAVVMSQEHVGSFRRGLENELAKVPSSSLRVSLEENPPAAVTALLGEVGEIKALTQPSNASLLARLQPAPHSEGIAALALKSSSNRSATERALSSPLADLGPDPSRLDASIPRVAGVKDGQGESLPSRESAPGKPTAPASASTPVVVAQAPARQTVTVLVWLTRRQSAGDDRGGGPPPG